jgi:hypothetical protein
MAAKKKPPQKKTPRFAPPTELALDALDRPIEGLANIARAAGIVDHRDRPRLRVVRYRLKKGYLPGFQRGERWFSTLRLLRSMSDQPVEAV